MVRLLKILVSTTLIIILVWNVDWDDLTSEFATMDPLLAFIAFILLWIQYPLSAFKWRKSLLLHGVDYQVGYLLRVHCIGFFFNSFLPTSIGGDTYRAYRTMDQAERPAHAISAVVMERAVGLASLVLLGYLAAIYLLVRGDLKNEEIILAGVVTGGVAMVATGIIWTTRSHEKLWQWLKRIRQLEPVIDSIRVINANKQHFAGLVAQSIFYQAFAIYTVALLFNALALKGTIAASAFSTTMWGVSGILPISINGIGVMESSFVVAALETGLPYEAALLVAAFLRAFMLLASVSFGTLYAFEPAKNKLKKMQAIDTPYAE